VLDKGIPTDNLRRKARRLPPKRIRIGVLAWCLNRADILRSVVFAVAVIGALVSNPVVAHSAGKTYFVSHTGNSADGNSWLTSWNELDQINWSVIQPGDTILIAGGTYHSTLNVGKSGQAGAPITLQAVAPVIIFGGRSALLPECDTPVASYIYQIIGVRNTGVNFNSNQWIVLDGGAWRGITIYGHSQYGISMETTAANITVRNVEIYDNGSAFQSVSDVVPGLVWKPDLPGVNLSGANMTFERAIIHDNGQDAFQSGGGLSNFTLRESWLYNGRYHSTATRPGQYGTEREAFNYCRHSDGIQIYSGGTQSGVTIERSILGPNFLQGTLLGQSGAGGTAVVNNVTIHDSLFYSAENANIMGYENSASQNWRIDHVTTVRPYIGSGPCVSGETNHNIFLRGGGHSVTNSIIVGGCQVVVPSDTIAINNCQWGIKSGPTLGIIANPQFVDPAHGNFALSASSPCAGLGSSITSVSSLISGVVMSPWNVFMPMVTSNR
jgi:hypothetical protein